MSLFFSTAILLEAAGAPPDTSDAYATAVVGLADLLAYWRMGDASASVLADASGNGHTGSYSGSPSFQATGLTEAWQASDGVCCDFAGNGSATIPHAAAFALGEATLSLWFQVNNLAAEQTLVGKDQLGAGSPDDQFAVHVATDGSIRTYFQHSGSSVDLQSIPGVIGVGERHHLCVVWSSGGVWVWLDGRYILKSYEHRTGLSGNTLDWRFGIRTYNDTLCSVRIDEVALFSRALFFQEIQILGQFVGGLGYDPTGATRTVNVSNASQLSSALSGAQPGDYIVLANGTYSGTFALDANGTRGSPIVVRSANGPSAVTIAGTFRLNGDWGILDGVRINAATGQCRITGDYCRITRVHRAAGRETVGIEAMQGSRFARIDHCFVDSTDANVSGTRHGIRLHARGPNVSDHSYYAIVDHSIARGATADVPIGTTPIVIGNGVDSTGSMHVYKCLVDQADDSGSIELKNIGGMVSHCTVTDGAYSHTRNGMLNEWRSCYIKTDHNAYGGYHKLIGCTFDGNSNDLRLPPGDVTPEQKAAGLGNYPSSTDVEIVGCTFINGAQVAAGNPTFSTGIDASGATAEGCTGFSVNYSSAHYSGTIFHNPTTTQPYEVAVELTSSDVGLAAADPLVPPGWK